MSFLQSERGGVGEREGLGPAWKASECGLAFGPVAARGSADPGLLFLSQNNNPLSSKAPTKGPIPTPVGGCGTWQGPLFLVVSPVLGACHLG